MEQQQEVRIGTRRAIGVGGRLLSGGREAATLGEWVVERLPEIPARFSFSAMASVSSAYWLERSPHLLALSVGHDLWTWRPDAVDVAIDGARLVGTLTGPPTITVGAVL